jgi:hypothetical protein
MTAISPDDCFDARTAEFPTRVVPIGAVTDLLSVPHAPEVVGRYRAAMLAGDRFPPVSVIRLGGRLLLADGHKRLRAYRSFQPETILVEVWSLARWLRDQRRQLRENARKNATILRRSFRDPAGAARLLGTTAAHWRRVARSLLRGPRSRP